MTAKNSKKAYTRTVQKTTARPVKKVVIRAATWIIPSTIVIAAAVITAIYLGAGKTSVPASDQSTGEVSIQKDTPARITEAATNTVAPSATKTTIPSKTLTSTPSFSFFGKWVIDPTTMGILYSQPPSGYICNPNIGYWPSPIIIRDSGDPASLIVEGLHEHIASETLPLDLQNMSVTSSADFPQINESSIGILKLMPDGRLYFEEQDFIGGVMYCQVYIYYILASE